MKEFKELPVESSSVACERITESCSGGQELTVLTCLGTA